MIRLKIFAEAENIKEVETIVSRNLKTSKIVDYGEGNSSILFQIPHLDELKNFFEWETINFCGFPLFLIYFLGSLKIKTIMKIALGLNL